jgi:hypothetical protein
MSLAFAQEATTPKDDQAADEQVRPQICFAPDTSDRYMQDVTRRYSSLFDPGNGLEFQLSARWTATATDGGGLVQGDPTTLTWSYVDDGLFIPGFAGEPGSNSNLQAWLNGLYGGFNTWHALFVQVFERWAEKTGITYVYEPNDDGAPFQSSGGVLGVRGDVRIGAHFIDGNSGILAYNFFPSSGGDMVLDSADNFFNDLSNNSLKFRNVVAHEHGHGMGLSHVCPVNQTKLMEPFATTAFDGPQFDDFLGAQRHYGDAYEHNDSSATATNLGMLTPNSPIWEDCLSVDDNSDQNFYAFTTGANGLLTATVAPPGVAPYLSGPQNGNGTCSAGVLFDPNIIHDLGFDIIDTDGTTVLISVNANPVGVAETLNNFPLPGAGTYFIRVFGDTTNNIQAYELHLEVADVECKTGGSCGEWNLPSAATNGYAYGILHDNRLNCEMRFRATLTQTGVNSGAIDGALYDYSTPVNLVYDVKGGWDILDDCGNGTWKADILLPGTNTIVGVISGKFCDKPITTDIGMYLADWEICE